MDPLEELSRQAIDARRKDIAEGKREKLADRDLLTLMRESRAKMLLASLTVVRVNASEDIAADQKMTETELSGQLATFMFAGSETTACANSDLPSESHH